MPSRSALIINKLLLKKDFRAKSRHLASLREQPEQFLETIRAYREKEDVYTYPTIFCCKVPLVKDYVDGRELFYIKSKKSKKKKKVIFYLHGGSYVQGPYPFHWTYMREIGKKTGLDVGLFNYPKSPETTCSRMVENTVDAYVKTLRRYPNHQIVLFGDSAGGGLCLSLFQVLEEKGIQLPIQMILLSPWLDVTMSNPLVKDYMETDLMLTVPGLQTCGAYFAGDLDGKDPKVSPMFGVYQNLPETHIFVGGSELFEPDCRLFVRQLQDQGKPITLQFTEGMQHIWPLLPSLQEGKEARKKIVQLINGLD